MIPSLLLLSASLVVTDLPAQDSRLAEGTATRSVKEKQWLVGEILIIGNTTTRQHIILRRVPFCPGYRISENDLRSAENALARTKLFRKRPSVRIENENGENEFKAVLIQVEEVRQFDPFESILQDALLSGVVQMASGLCSLLEINLTDAFCDFVDDWPVHVAQHPTLHFFAEGGLSLARAAAFSAACLAVTQLTIAEKSWDWLDSTWTSFNPRAMPPAFRPVPGTTAPRQLLPQ